MRRFSMTAIAASLALIGTLAAAQVQSTDATGTDAATGTLPDAQSGTGATAATGAVSTATTPNGAAAAKLVARFTALAGSEDNAASLVKGLRTGSEITLGTAGNTTNGSTAGTTGSTAGTTGATTGTAGSTSAASSGSVTFTPPTKPMGFGNVKIALSLAEAQLAAEGITQPTPQQLHAALVGGSTTTAASATAQPTSQTQGILQMRASGMGWGEIANSMGFKLGTVMSGRVTLEAAATSAQSASGTATNAAGTASTAGTNSGKPRGPVTASGATPVTKPSGYSRKASGIVTAAGTPMGHVQHGSRATGASGGMGNAYGASKSVAAGGASAQGNSHGKGNAFGHTK